MGEQLEQVKSSIFIFINHNPTFVPISQNVTFMFTGGISGPTSRLESSFVSSFKGVYCQTTKTPWNSSVCTTTAWSIATCPTTTPAHPRTPRKARRAPTTWGHTTTRRSTTSTTPLSLLRASSRSSWATGWCRLPGSYSAYSGRTGTSLGISSASSRRSASRSSPASSSPSCWVSTATSGLLPRLPSKRERMARIRRNSRAAGPSWPRYGTLSCRCRTLCGISSLVMRRLHLLQPTRPSLQRRQKLRNSRVRTRVAWFPVELSVRFIYFFRRTSDEVNLHFPVKNRLPKLQCVNVASSLTPIEFCYQTLRELKIELSPWHKPSLWPILSSLYHLQCKL